MIKTKLATHQQLISCNTSVTSQLPLAVQNLLHGGLCDQMIVALEPLIALLSYEGGVMAGLDCARMIHHGKQTVSE